MEPCKGLFWWTGERLLCVQFPCGADGNTLGAAAPLADWNNHRRAWARLPKDVTQGKAFDYYPRGGWNCGRGEPICFSPLFCAGRKWCCKSKTPLGWISCRSSSKRTAAIITAVIWTSKKEDKS